MQTSIIPLSPPVNLADAKVARKLAAAPDKDKLTAAIAAVSFMIGEMKSFEGEAVSVRIDRWLCECLVRMQEEVDTL
jgi:hypothetical protein